MKLKSFFLLRLLVLIFPLSVLIGIGANKYFYPVFPETVKIKVQADDEWGYPNNRQGTAVFVDDNLLLTAGHCVEDANEIIIIYSDGRECKAVSWYMVDENLTDLGIIVVDTNEVEPTAVLKDAKVGEKVIVWGNPFGYFPVRTEGIVSALNIDNDFFGEKNLFLIDAAVNPGNSGSATFNKRGHILGIVVGLKYCAQGNNFCVPAKVCNLVIERYKIEKLLEDLE